MLSTAVTALSGNCVMTCRTRPLRQSPWALTTQGAKCGYLLHPNMQLKYSTNAKSRLPACRSAKCRCRGSGLSAWYCDSSTSLTCSNVGKDRKRLITVLHHAISCHGSSWPHCCPQGNKLLAAAAHRMNCMGLLAEAYRYSSKSIVTCQQVPNVAVHHAGLQQAIQQALAEQHSHMSASIFRQKRRR